jgi:hypothetical protein
MGFDYMFNFFSLVSLLATKPSQNILQKEFKTHDDDNCNKKTAIACLPVFLKKKPDQGCQK